MPTGLGVRVARDGCAISMGLRRMQLPWVYLKRSWRIQETASFGTARKPVRKQSGDFGNAGT